MILPQRVSPPLAWPAPKSMALRPSASRLSKITAKRYPPHTSSLASSSASLTLLCISARSARSKSAPRVPSMTSGKTLFHASQSSTLPIGYQRSRPPPRPPPKPPPDRPPERGLFSCASLTLMVLPSRLAPSILEIAELASSF